MAATTTFNHDQERAQLQKASPKPPKGASAESEGPTCHRKVRFPLPYCEHRPQYAHKIVLSASFNQELEGLPNGQSSPPLRALPVGLCDEALPQSLVQATKRAFQVLQTVKRHYSRAVDYRAYRLANSFIRYDETVPNHVSKMVKKQKLEMKARFFDPSSLISIIGFLATLKLVCDTNRIRKRVAI